MSIPDLTWTAGASLNTPQMDSISGASSYLPTSSSDTASANSAVAQMRSDLQQNTQNFAALRGALNSNNLSGASQAYNNLQQDIQSASAVNGGLSPFGSNSHIGKNFQAIGQALKSGDLSAAKQAFTSFKADIKSAGRAARSQTDATSSQVGQGDASAGILTVATIPVTPDLKVGGVLNTTA